MKNNPFKHWTRQSAAIFFGKSLFLMLVVAVMLGGVEYTDELQDQIKEIQNRTPEALNLPYFHDMGIVAKKADEAEIHDLATTIVRTHLLEKMETYVKDKILETNQKYQVNESQEASKNLEMLGTYKVYYEPSQEYLITASARAISSEIGNERERAIELVESACDEENLIHGITALQKTALFTTRNPAETMAVRKLSQEVNCCMSWKSQVKYLNVQKFETDYDAGTLTEDAQLKLQTSGSNWNEATWVGTWKYTVQAKEGKAEGMSQATLRHRRGEDIADLVISLAKLNSVGRVNLPVPLAGDHRTLEISGSPVHPLARIGSQDVALAGCHETKESS